MCIVEDVVQVGSVYAAVDPSESVGEYSAMIVG
jgi:hypothetical protein